MKYSCHEMLSFWYAFSDREMLKTSLSSQAIQKNRLQAAFCWQGHGLLTSVQDSDHYVVLTLSLHNYVTQKRKKWWQILYKNCLVLSGECKLLGSLSHHNKDLEWRYHINLLNLWEKMSALQRDVSVHIPNKILGGGLVTKLCPTPCSLPGCSVHGILQARLLEWVAISFSREW